MAHKKNKNVPHLDIRGIPLGIAFACLFIIVLNSVPVGILIGIILGCVFTMIFKGRGDDSDDRYDENENADTDWQ